MTTDTDEEAHAAHIHTGGSVRRRRGILLFGLTALAAAIGLYHHGKTWWYAPLVALAPIAAHAVVISGIAFLLGRHAKAHGGAWARQEGIVTNPRLYNLIVSLATLGRERHLRRRIVAVANVGHEDDVLDVGCGTGSLLLEVSQTSGFTGSLHGIEPSTALVNYANERAAASKTRMEIVEAYADKLPYPDARFDTVFCTFVLHHIPKDGRAKAMAEMRRVLRPGGSVIMVDLQKPKSLVRFWLTSFSLLSVLHGGVSSDMHFDFDALAGGFERLGFPDISRRSLGSGAIGVLVAKSKGAVSAKTVLHG